jgi:hypothetical protein
MVMPVPGSADFVDERADLRVVRKGVCEDAGGATCTAGSPA